MPLQHLAKNHPLPDTNERASFLLTPGSSTLRPATRPPDVETDAGLVERVATGDAGHEEVMAWISERTREKGDESPPSP